MGFRLDRTYKLRWDDGTDLAGFEVDIRGTSVATMRAVRDLRLSQDESQLAEILAAHIKRWNMEDENGEPVPVTAAALLDQESVVLAAIAREWYLAAAGVSAPLDLGSTSTAPSGEASLPMEAL